MSYNLDKDFERQVCLLAVQNKNFWLRIGNKIRTEELAQDNQLFFKLCHAVATDHGWPSEDLIVQRASLWMTEGAVSEEEIGKLSGFLGERTDIDPERVIAELIEPVRRVWQQDIARKVIDRYKNTSPFGLLPDEMSACDRLGEPIADAEVKSSEFGEDTESVLEEAPTGIKLATGIIEIDNLFRGGWPLGTLLTILMDSKSGKSMTCAHMTAVAALQGENAAYLSLELPKSEIHKRILAALVGVPINDLDDPNVLRDALAAWKNMKARGRVGRIVIDKFDAGSLDTKQVAAWFAHQEKVHSTRFRFRVVDYGDLVQSPNRADRDSAYNRGSTVWQALAVMAQNPENPNWVLTPTQSKRPDWKPGQPIPMLTRAHVADSVHKYRLSDFFITATPQPDIQASAGFLWYIDADRFFGKTGTPVGPVPHMMHMARMSDISHL